MTKISEGVFRGPHPILIQDWMDLRAAGIKYSLDLETGVALMADGSPLSEQLEADTYGIRTFSHPLGEFLPPSKSELELAVQVMTKYQPIYVHCKAGVDRTGMVTAKYRMTVDGWDFAKSVREMFHMGMHPWYWWWALFL